jgi:hypothetical protein
MADEVKDEKIEKLIDKINELIDKQQEKGLPLITLFLQWIQKQGVTGVLLIGVLGYALSGIITLDGCSLLKLLPNINQNNTGLVQIIKQEDKADILSRIKRFLLEETDDLRANQETFVKGMADYTAKYPLFKSVVDNYIFRSRDVKELHDRLVQLESELTRTQDIFQIVGAIDPLVAGSSHADDYAYTGQESAEQILMQNGCIPCETPVLEKKRADRPRLLRLSGHRQRRYAVSRIR